MTPLHFNKFNEKIKAMNSSASKELRLTAAEARALHSEIFGMLDEMNALREQAQTPSVIEVTLDPGDNSL